MPSIQEKLIRVFDDKTSTWKIASMEVIQLFLFTTTPKIYSPLLHLFRFVYGYSTFELRVVLENGGYFSYQNPSNTVCISFEDCNGWKAAKSGISQRSGLSTFFKSNHCNANDGDIYYYTGKEAGDVLHTFKTLLTIRSIYARPMWGNYPWSVAQKKGLAFLTNRQTFLSLLTVSNIIHYMYVENLRSCQEEYYKKYGFVTLRGLLCGKTTSISGVLEYYYYLYLYKRLVGSRRSFLVSYSCRWPVFASQIPELTLTDLAVYAVILLLKAGRPGISTNISDPYRNLVRVFNLVKPHPKVVEWNAAHA
ncbi:hypothetical protein GQ600_6913 [Phytophthora cactorum]|nr:hypothetical protein GQ600_6913 [Phytophthora cactorum]